MIPPDRGDIWALPNLFAWATVPWDARKRNSEERAQMLKRLGLKNLAYDWRDSDIPTFPQEIETMKRNDINIFAWWFPLEADDPKAKQTLDFFKRLQIHPQLWVPQSFREMPKDWNKLLPKGITPPTTEAEYARLSDRTKHEIELAIIKQDLLGAPQEQRIHQETIRIEALVKLAAPYGSQIELYGHNGWYGNMDNLVALIHSLQERGITNVGIVYNFLTARDELHNDAADFRQVWNKIQPYVVAVTLTGVKAPSQSGQTIVCPSQGEDELKMMRVIENSHWSGPVGIIAESGGDAQVTLGNCLAGLSKLAGELKWSENH